MQSSSGKSPLCVCRKGQQYYAQECIAQPAQDCSVKANNNCPSCGLYNQDALPYVNQNDYHITLPGSVHSLVGNLVVLQHIPLDQARILLMCAHCI